LADQKNTISSKNPKEILTNIEEEIDGIMDNFRKYLNSLKSNEVATEYDFFQYLKLLQHNFSEADKLDINYDFDENIIKKSLNNYELNGIHNQ
jgi:hypothetical protein